MLACGSKAFRTNSWRFFTTEVSGQGIDQIRTRLRQARKFVTCVLASTCYPSHGTTPVPKALELIPEARRDRPRAHPRRPVAPEYLRLRGCHPDHPGHGLGPGRV